MLQETPSRRVACQMRISPVAQDSDPPSSLGQRIRRTSRFSGDQHTQFARQMQPSAAPVHQLVGIYQPY